MVCDKCKSHFRVMMSSFIVVVVVVLLYGLVYTRLEHVVSSYIVLSIL